MDKIVFLNELSTISDDPVLNKQNFDRCMLFCDTVNTFYEALKYISREFNAYNEIVVAPVNFEIFAVPPGEFRFMFSKKVKSVIQENITIRCSTGFCTIRKNEQEAGYIVSVTLSH